MKLLKAEIKGLIGLYRGSNVKTITIDFTKCLNNITLIIGGNGSGKTTLMEALHPLPDSASIYIPGEEGYKSLSYLANDNVYEILIQYPVNKYGDRTTTKAYIKKINNGEVVDLNPNGNVTSYKDCLYTEFMLDANFAALTSLSIEDKGIVGKTPSERKRFVGSIVSRVEVFNSIYKTLNKRSSIFKSMINSLVSKIDSIGSEEALEASLKLIDVRIESLSNNRDLYIKKLSGAEMIVNQLDMNGQVQDNYNKLHAQLDSVNSSIETVKLFIAKYNRKPYDVYMSDKEKCSYNHSVMVSHIAILESELKAERDKLQTLLKEQEEDLNILNIKNNRMNSLRSQYNFEELFVQLKNTKDRIKRILKLFDEIGISPNNTLTKDEFILGLSTLKAIKEQIDVFRSFSYEHHISKVINYISDNISPEQELNDIIKEIASVNLSITETDQKISYNRGLLQRGEILSQRPNKCKIDDCSFIKDALLAMSNKPEEQISKLEKTRYCLMDKMNELDVKRREYEEILTTYKYIYDILRMISSNRVILDKLPNGEIFTKTDSFLNNLASGDTFNCINDLYKYMDYANVFEYYKKDKEMLVKLESEHEIYKNRSSIIDEISSDIKRIQKSLDGIVAKVEESNNKLIELEKEIDDKKGISDILAGINRKYEELDKLLDEKMELEESIIAISSNMKAIEKAIQDINAINSNILAIDNELKPIKEEKESIKFSLNRLKEYNEELAAFTAKYNTIEVIKKYSSPTKAGIQNMFIKVYMGQTLNLANKLLSMFFDGKLKLLEYKINEDEFRIPCTSSESNLINDDINSCSGGERAMMALIISAALLQQSSTLYNILRLDEIDGTLDQKNKAMFIELLFIIIDILGIENCIMISHASESVLDNVDLICLDMKGLSVPKGNVIYQITA